MERVTSGSGRRTAILCIDEVGYLSFDDKATDSFPTRPPIAVAFNRGDVGVVEQTVEQRDVAAALLEELHRQSPEGRRLKLRTYTNVGLLILRSRQPAL